MVPLPGVPARQTAVLLARGGGPCGTRCRMCLLKDCAAGRAETFVNNAARYSSHASALPSYRKVQLFPLPLVKQEAPSLCLEQALLPPPSLSTGGV